MALQISPGVQIQEIDQTTTTPTVSTTDAAFVGAFRWGPANTRITITNENQLVGRFFGPDANTFLSFFSAANFLAYGDNLKVVRAVGSTSRNATVDATGLLIENGFTWQNSYFSGAAAVGEFAARFPGDLGNSLLVSVCPSTNAFAQTFPTNIAANTTAGQASLSFNVAINTVIASGDLVKIGVNPYLKVISVAANGLYATVNSGAAVLYTGLGNTVSRRWGFFDYFTSAPGTSPYALSNGGANDEMHIAVVDANGKFSTSGANTVIETYAFASKAADSVNTDGTGNYVRDVLFNRSAFVYWMKNVAAGTNWGSPAAGITFTEIGTNYYYQLAGGVHGLPTDGNLESGWDLFANPDEVDVSLMITGNASPTLANYVISSVAEVRKDAIVFVSPRQSDVVNQIGSEVSNITTFRNTLPSSSFAFADSGWKYMYDKYNNVYRWVPLNGDTAGCVVRTDTQRDAWFSPAGFNRGQIKNAIKLAWNPNQTQRDDLYKIGINPVVAFPGQGVTLYGDKTLQSKPSAFDRINVRRLFNILEKTIGSAAKYSLFEFNDEFTRSQFVNLVEPFLRDVQGRGGIYEYRVVCDETNNTPFVIDNNRFVGDIYIKPTRSINFITLSFVAVGTGISFTEKAGV